MTWSCGAGWWSPRAGRVTRTWASPAAGWRNSAAGASAVDYVLHPVLPVPTPEALAELPGLAADGFRTLKIFMVMDEFEEHTAGMIEAIRAAGRLGMLTLLHCEDAALVRFAGE